MNKVYLVLTDQVEGAPEMNGAFSTEQKANYAARLHGAGARVEAVTLDELPEHPEGCVVFGVYLDSAGTVLDVSECQPFWADYSGPPTPWPHGLKFWLWALHEADAIAKAREQLNLVKAGQLKPREEDPPPTNMPDWWFDIHKAIKENSRICDLANIRARIPNYTPPS